MKLRFLSAGFGLTLVLAACAVAQTTEPAGDGSLLHDASVTLFQNVRVFDGKN